MSVKSKPCDCGGRFEKQNAKGRFFAFGEFGKVKLQKDLEVQLCKKCGEVLIRMNDYSLDNALKESLSANVEELLDLIKRRYRIFNKEVASFLGMTPETLSRYQNETSEQRIPSPAFLELKNIFMGGPQYMREVRDCEWGNESSAQSSGSGGTGSGYQSIVASSYR